MLSGAELRELLERHLREHYRSAVGQILYSGIETLNPGKYYIVGLNPRPDNSNRVLREIPLELRRWSAYTCQCWNLKHIHHKELPVFLQCGDQEHNHGNTDSSACECAGRDKHQIHVWKMLKQLTEGTERTPCDVFATNIFFVETKNTTELKRKFGADILKFWQIHRRFLREVKPKYVICLGYDADFSAFSLMHELAKSQTQIMESQAPYRWKDGPSIKWFQGEYCLDDGTTLCTTVAGVYHPSYRSIPTTVRTLLEQIPAPECHAEKARI